MGAGGYRLKVNKTGREAEHQIAGSLRHHGQTLLDAQAAAGVKEAPL